MAATASNPGVKNSWSLVDFAKAHGKMKVTNEFSSIDPESGEERHFKSCAFIGPNGGITLVGFSSKLGELTPQQIASQKDNLQVVELQSGSYKLCASGANSWEDVDLGL